MNKRIVIFFILLLTLIVQVNASELCTNEASKTDLEITKIYDPEFLEETEWLWTPNQEKIIQVEVKNKNLTSRDFQLKLFLLDENLEIIEKFTTINVDPLKILMLGKNTTFTINFTFEPKEQNNETYFLYAKLFDIENESICAELKAKEIGNEIGIRIEEEKRIVVVRKIYGPETITSGSSVEYTAEIANIGNEKENRILIIAFNQALNLRQEKEITNLEAEQAKNVTFNFTIPENITTTQEQILFGTEFDYNEATSIYEKYSDKDKTFIIQITQNQTIPIITKETAPMATQKNETTTYSAPEQKSEKSPSPLFWIIIATIVIIILVVILIIFFYSRKEKNQFLPKNPEMPNEVKNYLEKINGINPSPTSPNKPSEMNTAGTNTPQTFQNLPQQPRYPTRPEVTSSSPKSKPANISSSLQAPQNPPQKNQP